MMIALDNYPRSPNNSTVENGSLTACSCPRSSERAKMLEVGTKFMMKNILDSNESSPDQHRNQRSPLQSPDEYYQVETKKKLNSNHSNHFNRSFKGIHNSQYGKFCSSAELHFPYFEIPQPKVGAYLPYDHFRYKSPHYRPCNHIRNFPYRSVSCDRCYDREHTSDSSNEGSPFSDNSPLKLKEKRKRTRTIFTKEQVLQLEKSYTTNRYLTGIARQEIAKKLKMSSCQVKIWFQNKRNKDKKEKYIGDILIQENSDHTQNQASKLEIESSYSLNNHDDDH